MAHVPEGRGIFANLTVEENLVLAFRQRLGRKQVPDALDQAYAGLPRSSASGASSEAAPCRAGSNACSRWPRC